MDLAQRLETASTLPHNEVPQNQGHLHAANVNNVNNVNNHTDY